MNTKYLIPIFLISLGLSFSIVLKAESIFFIFTDGTTTTIDLNDVHNISFAGDFMNLNKTDGTTISWNVGQIQNYQYVLFTDLHEAGTYKDLAIYPNPTEGDLSLSLELIESDQISIMIIDAQGNVVHNWPTKKFGKGKHYLNWQANDFNGRKLAAGNYWCKITGIKGTISRLIVLQ